MKGSGGDEPSPKPPSGELCPPGSVEAIPRGIPCGGGIDWGGRGIPAIPPPIAGAGRGGGGPSSRVPQAPQKRACASSWVPHFGQFIVAQSRVAERFRPREDRRRLVAQPSGAHSLNQLLAQLQSGEDGDGARGLFLQIEIDPRLQRPCAGQSGVAHVPVRHDVPVCENILTEESHDAVEGNRTSQSDDHAPLTSRCFHNE